MSKEKRKEYSLVVRLWQVKSDSDENTWRGSIERVPDGNGSPVYFHSLEVLFEKIKVILEGKQGDLNRKDENK